MPGEPVASSMSDQPFRVGEWLVEPMLDQVTRGTEMHHLEPRTMRVLVRLAQTAGKVVSSEELLDSAWSGVIVSPASVYQAISQLRKLLGDTDETPRYIATVPRRGYRLVAAVSRKPDEPAEAPPPPMPAAPSPPLAAASDAAIEARAPLPPPSRRQRWPWIAAAGALAVASILIALMRREPHSMPAIATTPESTTRQMDNALAVLPFETDASQPDKNLVQAIRLMLFERLSAITALPVIGTESSWAFAAHGFDVRDAQRILHSRFLLKGRVTRSGDQLHLVAELFDTSSGAKLWSQSFDRSTNDLTAVREAIVQGILATIDVDGSTRSEASRTPIRFDAYALYAEGDQLILDDSSLADIDKAASVFSRTTSLDPAFARGYLGVGKALMYHAAFQPSIYNSADVIANARQAYDRALELDPGLGDAWAERARSVEDPKLAEQQFRKGLALAPNYMLGSMSFADFLSGQGRSGEASEVLTRALELDPYSATLHVLSADAVMSARSDVEQALKLYRTALEIHPDYEFAMDRMVMLEYQVHGTAATAIRRLDRPQVKLHRPALAWMYLDVDDPDAAQDVWWSPPDAPPHLMPGIHLYRGNTRAAAEVARKVLATPEHPAHSLAALAMRDEAVASGDYAGAIATVEPVYLRQKENWTRVNADRGLAEAYASLLIFAGRRQEGEHIVRSLLSRIEADEIGRPAHWFANERAPLYAVLGENERALAELAAGQKLGHWNNWWYTADRDPAFAHVRQDSRFRALADAAKKHRLQQRALVDDMRRKGEIPRRGAPQGR